VLAVARWSSASTYGQGGRSGLRGTACTARLSWWDWCQETMISGVVWLQEVVDKIGVKHQMSARDMHRSGHPTNQAWAPSCGEAGFGT
jgi:hypothetical protein